MNRSIEDVGGGILVVSQFTLLAETRKGNRPSFIRAAAPGVARQIYERFCMRLEQEIGRAVGRGVFGARMQVSLVNDGPVTICIVRTAGSEIRPSSLWLSSVISNSLPLSSFFQHQFLRASFLTRQRRDLQSKPGSLFP